MNRLKNLYGLITFFVTVSFLLNLYFIANLQNNITLEKCTMINKGIQSLLQKNRYSHSENISEEKEIKTTNVSKRLFTAHKFNDSSFKSNNNNNISIPQFEEQNKLLKINSLLKNFNHNLINNEFREENIIANVNNFLNSQNSHANIPMKTFDTFKPSNFSILSLDGQVRNCITNDVIGRVPETVKFTNYINPRIIKGKKKEETLSERKQSFQRIFNQRSWGSGWDTSYSGLNASGMGSTLYWSQEMMLVLNNLINMMKKDKPIEYKIKLLDVACGDMAWMSRFLTTRNDIDYTGIDIVPALIKNHRKIYAHKGWKFMLVDILDGDSLYVTMHSNISYDIILCRMLLQHIYYIDIKKLLIKFSKNQNSYLLTTTFIQQSENSEVNTNHLENPGRFRKLNLELPPITLGPPLCLSRDGSPDSYEGSEHFIGLWKLPLSRPQRCKHSVNFKISSFVDKDGMSISAWSCVHWGLK